MRNAGPIHLRPADELAERVLLPGDPGRAMAVAQLLLDKPRMFNHARGLWGYTGTAADGFPLTVQATGMGGPSAAIVIEELVMLGARTLIRIGTCGALDAELLLGDLVVGRTVIADDGTSRALGAGERLDADPVLTDALERTGARPVVIVSTDLFYGAPAAQEQRWRAAGANVVEMEAATLLALAERRGFTAAVVLAVTDEIGGPERRRIDPAGLDAAGIRLGEVAYAALARLA